MNEVFKEYVRSSSFRLDLSERMIYVLIAMAKGKQDERLNLHPYFALERRGLIEWKGGGGEKHGPYLTDAGNVVVELLMLSGYE